MTRLIFCLLAASSLMWAQTTAQINGAVKDSSGLAVPGANVKATQTATGAVRTVVSGADGGYVLANLPIGPYLVEVSKEGFSKYVQSGIVLQVDANPVVDATLKVGAVSEQVTVQADASLVETHSTTVGTVVDNQRVLEMPLNGRNVTELIFLAGMATPGVGTSTLRNYPTILISVAGAIGNMTNYVFDGVGHNDSFNNLNLPLPFPDALQEFKVETSALPAQYGTHAGATVNVITKSGANEFHGDAFEFIRNGVLNARDFFAPTRDTLKRNQFGGVVGGRIIRDKLFFFGGWQDTILRSTPTQASAYVPTPAMLQGDFTAFASPACNSGRQITLSPAFGFAGNKISPSLFSPAGQKVVSQLLPPTNDPCGKVFYPLLNNQKENMYVFRTDYQKSDKNTMYLRGYIAALDVPTTFVPGNGLTLFANASKDRVYTLAFGDTYLFGPSFVNSFRIGANRSEVVKVPDQAATWPQLGVNEVFNPDTEPRIAVTGGNGFTIGSGTAIISNDLGGPNPNVSDDVSWVKGAHQIAFGGSWLRQSLNYASGINGTGLMTINGSFTGMGMADLLTGNVNTWAHGNVQDYVMNRQQYFGLYLQDSWKPTSRLTLNYGVRWEPYFGTTNKHGYLDNVLLDLFNNNFHSTLYPNAPAGLIFPGDPQWTPNGYSVAKPRYGVFLPRVGLVWDPVGDGKMTIRASVGAASDRNPLYSLSSMAQDSPYGSVISVPSVKLDNPWATYPGGNPLPIRLSKNLQFPAFAPMVSVNFDSKPLMVSQFNLAIQRQFGKDWLIQANYIGNTVAHVLTGGEINPAVYRGSGPCTFPASGSQAAVTFPNCATTASNNYRRVLYAQNPAQGQFYGTISTFDDGGTQTYNGLYLSAQKRLSGGISILTNYTWSHCIGDTWNADPGNNGLSGFTPGNRKNDRGNCPASDQRQVFNFSGVGTTPKFANRALRIFASDWQFAPILKVKSAQFFTITTGVDTALNGETSNNQRANRVAGVDPRVSDPHACSTTFCVAWANPAAYAAAPTGQLGTSSIFSNKGPGIIQIDLAVSRTFAVWEKKTVQFRAEAFNLPNHLNPATPGSTPGTVTTNNPNTFSITNDISGTSGLSSGDYRVIQAAIKFVF